MKKIMIMNNIFRICALFLCVYTLLGCKESKDVSPENEGSTIKSWMLSTLDPLGAYLYLDTKTEDNLSIVKGEYESLQLVLKADNTKQLQIIHKKKDSPLDISLRRLTKFEGVNDVLVPCNDTIGLNNGLAYLWITVHAKTTTPSGKYNEEVIVKSGTSTISLQISVNVEDISLPERSSIPIVFGVDPERIVKSGSNESELEKKKKEIFDLLLNYRISPYQSNWLQNSKRLEVISSPYEWNDERTLKYMSDPRFSAIALPYWKLNLDQLRTFLNQVENAGLIDKIYFYLWDEPTKMEEYNKIIESANIIHSVNPKARILTTYYRGPEDGPHANDFYAVPDISHGAINIYCTSVWALQNDESNAKKIIQKLGDKEEWWTYTAMGIVPGFSYDSSPIQNRAIMWRTWKENSAGFLFWVVNWFSSLDPLSSIAEKGDGILVYPGEAFGVTGPVVSVRLERFRDGAEDYELLKMLEKKKGREFTENILKEVYQSPVSITNSSSKVEAFRKDLITGLLK